MKLKCPSPKEVGGCASWKKAMIGKKVFANLIMVFLYSTYMKPLDFMSLDKYLDYISDKAGDTLI